MALRLSTLDRAASRLCLLLLLNLLLSAPPAHATPTDADRQPGSIDSVEPTSQRKPQQKARVTVFLLPAKGFSDQLIARVSNWLRTTLRKDPNLQVKDWSKLLVEFSGEVPSDEISQAKALRDEGLAALEAKDLPAAIAKLTAAMEQFESVLAHTRKQYLAQTQLALAVALWQARRRQQAAETLASLLVWRPMMRFDADRFGTEMLPLFEKARAAAKKSTRGSVELTTRPPGARAYVDGRYVGVTPTVAFGLPVGRHYATFKRPGFIKAAQKVEVDPKMQRTYLQELARSEKFLLMQQTIKEASKGLGKAEANAAMLDLRSVLFVDQVLFCTMGFHRQGQIRLQAYLYDLRSKLRLNQTSLVVSEKNLAQLDELTRALYLNVRYDGTLEVPPEPPPPVVERPAAFYTRWWFWSSIAAGAAAIVMTAVLWPTDASCQGNSGGADRCIRW